MDILGDVEFWRLAGEVTMGVVMVTVGAKLAGAKTIIHAMERGIKRYSNSNEPLHNNKVVDIVNAELPGNKTIS